jgi:hypothetical protein
MGVDGAKSMSNCWLAYALVCIVVGILTLNTCTASSTLVLVAAFFELLHIWRYRMSFATKIPIDEDDEEALTKVRATRFSTYCCVEELFLIYLILAGICVPIFLTSMETCPDMLALVRQLENGDSHTPGFFLRPAHLLQSRFYLKYLPNPLLYLLFLTSTSPLCRAPWACKP